MGWLLLCAGQSRRFGSNKLLADLDNGKRVLEQTLDSLSQSGEPILAICRPETQAIYDLLEQWRVAYSVAPNAALGMGHSLAWGFSQVDSWDWAGVVLADMPYINPETFQKLAKVADSESIVVPEVMDESGSPRTGNPVIFGKSYFQFIRALEGDVGARSVVRRFVDKVVKVRVEDPAVLYDIDKPSDIR
ncbi:nucleotidyltransferase family protein [Hahella ganghwensis]|uniref:nucleotidyltransferase family protein n=1 Tax=Hahella ganghwensis TaxID=286420 RepID=UPI00035D2615|nr:nucleotidyltransferase family protein [Hahella ganghwensis]